MHRRLFTFASLLSMVLCAASGWEWGRSYHRLDFGSHLLAGQTVEWLSDAGSIAVVTLRDLRDHSTDDADAYPLRKRDTGYILAFGPSDNRQTIRGLKHFAVGLTRKSRWHDALCVVDQILQLDPVDDYGLGVKPILEDHWAFQMAFPGKAFPRNYYDLWPGPWQYPEQASIPSWTNWRREFADRSDASDAGYLRQIRSTDRRWLGFHYAKEDIPAFHGRGLVFSHWLLVAIFAILPATFVYLSCRRMMRARAGRCADCGYDLRATPTRCPECGSVRKERYSAQAGMTHVGEGTKIIPAHLPHENVGNGRPSS
ncbi:MAG TPA: hypothetical protein VFE47_20000 [Tepidisphaeraceae bacterium]|jgi:hypothetical protein|nr:hypothetical protein [Tepidisphaeraceae bacterium]